ncbi:MAG: radical SAM protein [Candidatus Staskawiczbacteria bacterium]|nr:radical SAM protein [Candidatus Staskawiczbacteria bacterium]
MKKILLIAPSYKEIKTSNAVPRYNPPVGVLNLASFLFEKGYKCDIVDTAFEEIDWDKIKRGDYFLVGLTIFIGEFMKNAKEIASKIKKIDPLLPVCFGGVMASLYPERILKEYDVDFIVRYEGEYTLFELVQFLEQKGSLKDIKGLSYKEGGVVINNPPRFLENNLDNFPVPKWDLFGKNCNKEQIPYYFRIMTSKGCPFSCSFCYHRSVDDEIKDKSPRWRSRSAEHVISEIESIHNLTKTRVFSFGDDNFLVNKDRAIKIFTHVKERNFYVEQCIAHMNNLSDEIISAMGGVVQTVIYAIESASPRLLKLLNKNLDLSKIPEINRKLFDKKITTNHNIIVGLPTETDQELRLNIELMMKLKEINPYVRCLTYLFFPLPFTSLNSYIENEMGLPLPKSLKDYEDASLDSGREEGRKFRVWLSKERYDFLHNYCQVFDDAFQVNNMSLSEKSLKLLHDDPKLKEMFSGIEKVNRPKVFYRPYILDRVLNNEEIILMDLKKMNEA